jgi:3'-5' exoribonuclease
VSLMDISSLREAARTAAVCADIRCQAEEVILKESANGKPYFELKVRDASGGLTLRAWNDSPAFAACESLSAGAAIEISGEFSTSPAFGLEGRRWSLRALNSEEAEALFGGEEAEAATAGLSAMEEILGTIRDPRLAALCRVFLDEHGSRFLRAAAARQNHHARRGGLLAHTLQMMRAADALSGVYTALNRDLLLAGTLFHDGGKLWETCPPEHGFGIPREVRGELLGHISIGIEMVNALWRKLPLEDWKGMTPPTELVRMHLLHLLAAHHGQLEFGSPVAPKTPEAVALHFIDNLDARLEMLTEAWKTLPECGPGILERVRPLGVNPVSPLPPFEAETENCQ